MNAMNQQASVVVSSTATQTAKVENPNNAWRKAVTQDAISALMKNETPNLEPFRSFPWNDRDDDRGEKSFALSSLKHTLDYLKSDTRDLDKMNQRLEWLRNAPGKLNWMREEYSVRLRSFLLPLVNRFKSAATAIAQNKSKIAETFSKLALDKEQAVCALTDAKAIVENSQKLLEHGSVNDMYDNKVLRTDVVCPDFLVKILGLQAKLSEVQGGDLERLAHDIALVSAKRQLAASIEDIISSRESQLTAAKAAAVEMQKTVDEELTALLGNTAEVAAPAPVQRKSTTYIKPQPPKARKEITTTIDGLADALVHKAVQDVKPVRCNKAEAMELLGVPEELFEEAVQNALTAGEEEVLSFNGPNPGCILVKKQGNCRRFFVKQAVAA